MKRFLCAFTMIKVHHIKRITNPTVGTRLILGFSYGRQVAGLQSGVTSQVESLIVPVVLPGLFGTACFAVSSSCSLCLIAIRKLIQILLFTTDTTDLFHEP